MASLNSAKWDILGIITGFKFYYYRNAARKPIGGNYFLSEDFGKMLLFLPNDQADKFSKINYKSMVSSKKKVSVMFWYVIKLQDLDYPS